MPNEPLVFQFLGFINRRQGRWVESEHDLQRSLELDPRNAFLFQQLALTYSKLRQYEPMADALDHALQFVPDDVGTRVQRAGIALDWRADPKPEHVAIQSILTKNPDAAGDLAQSWFVLANCERDAKAVAGAVAAIPADGGREEGFSFPHQWYEGLAARLRGDATAAEAAFAGARDEQQRIVARQPDYPEGLGVLGLIDAALGRKDEAIREGRRAVELLPPTKDSINGALAIQYMAIIYAWTGEKDSALKELALAVSIPGDISYGLLRLHPNWDSLRGDPGFEKIVASMAPTAGDQ